MIYQDMTSNDFVRAFDEADRSKNFSVNARRTLFDYILEIANMHGEDVELDVIALCCHWAEYTAAEIVEQFGYMLDREPEWDDDEYLSEIVELLSYSGTVLVVEHIGEPDTYLFSE